MTEAAKNITSLRPPEQVAQQNEPLEPWSRQKQEPARWYLRFRRYLDMGPKRSLRATIASEPQNEKAKRGDKYQQKISNASIPGAWSRAAKLWRWKERADAFDLAQLEKQATFVREAIVHQPFASKAFRLICLCGMVEGLNKYSRTGFTLEENVLYIKTMQSLFKDIEHEMEGLDETTKMMADAYAQKRLMEKALKI
jgi:hypothetical protein